MVRGRSGGSSILHILDPPLGRASVVGGCEFESHHFHLIGHTRQAHNVVATLNQRQ